MGKEVQLEVYSITFQIMTIFPHKEHFAYLIIQVALVFSQRRIHLLVKNANILNRILIDSSKNLNDFKIRWECIKSNMVIHFRIVMIVVFREFKF